MENDKKLQMEKIIQYVKDNYETLPKTNINNEEIGIEIFNINKDIKYYEHNYEGVIVNKNGNVYFVFSSGDSYTGSAYVEEDVTFKVYTISNNTYPEGVFQYWQDFLGGGKIPNLDGGEYRDY